LRFRNSIFFLRSWVVILTPNPKLEGQGIHSCLGHHP
jgi:hypothetical protein